MVTAAIETYKAYHPLMFPCFVVDVKTFNPRAPMQKLDIRSGEFDLLVGCPPCQGFPLAFGTSIVDCSAAPRNSLVPNVAGCIDAFRPRCNLDANHLPGILRSDIFSAVCKKR